jgi:hypothetical protein
MGQPTDGILRRRHAAVHRSQHSSAKCQRHRRRPGPLGINAGRPAVLLGGQGAGEDEVAALQLSCAIKAMRLRLGIRLTTSTIGVVVSCRIRTSVNERGQARPARSGLRPGLPRSTTPPCSGREGVACSGGRRDRGRVRSVDHDLRCPAQGASSGRVRFVRVRPSAYLSVQHRYVNP